jgi:hypothetical protein
MEIRRFMACVLLAAAALSRVEGGAHAAQVNVSLNLFFQDVRNQSLGGTWTLVAKTDSMHGIAGIDFVMRNVDHGPGDITLEPDIGAYLIGGEPLVFTSGGVTTLTYGQDTTDPPVVLGVGTASMSDGADPLGNSTWNNATKIGSGTFGATVPSFTSITSPPQTTDANVFTQSSSPYNTADATTTAVVRAYLPGDYNRNGSVNTQDLNVWRGQFGLTGAQAADGNRNGKVDAADYVVWRRHAGITLPVGSGAVAAIPEPSSIGLAVFAVAVAGWWSWRRAA